MAKNNDESKRGRPEMEAGERRSIILQFRVTEGEKKRVEKAAGKTKLSDWLRDRALTSA